MQLSGNAKTDQAKLPSLLQWLKTVPSDLPPVHKVIQVVWFPNQFPNFSVDTESFRLRIPVTETNQLELFSEFESAIEESQVLCVTVDPAKKGSWEIKTLEGEIGSWEELGAHGYKCQVQEKTKANSKRASKKLVQE